MAIQQPLDVTEDFNADGLATLDIGGWDYAEVQLISPSGTVNFLTSNDSGDITGVSDGSAVSASNFNAVMGTNLATGTGVTSLAAAGTVKFTGIGRYLRLSGVGVTATKVLVRLYKSF